jgi:Kelch motif
MVALDGKVHAIGGRGLDKVTVATHEVYDPASDKWSSAAPILVG